MKLAALHENDLTSDCNHKVERYDEGVKQNIKDYFEGKVVLNPNFLIRMLMKYSLDVVTTQLLNQNEKVKKHAAGGLRKWVKKNKGQMFYQRMKSILSSLDRAVGEKVTEGAITITEVVKLDTETEKKLDMRVRQVNNIINDAGDDREDLAYEVIDAIASNLGHRAPTRQG